MDDGDDQRHMEHEAVSRLAQHLHEALLAHFARQPKDNTAVLEALNALAAVSATVLRGTDFAAWATRFFFMALTGCANAEPGNDVRDEAPLCPTNTPYTQ